MPSILQGVVSQPIDLAGAIARGQQFYNQNQQSRLNQQLTSQQIGKNEYEQNLRKLQIANRLAKQAISLPPEQRQRLMSDYYGVLTQVGFTQDDLANTPLDDTGLQNLIAQTDSVLMSVQGGSGANQQFGGQETLKDEQGNLFFAT